MIALYAIFVAKYSYCKFTIDTYFETGTNFNVTDPRDIEMFNYANACDTYINIDILSAAHKNAKLVETRICELFTNTIGSDNIQSEDEIRENQINKHGRAIATPDLLFRVPIIINHYIINWIEIKDYAGLPFDWIHKSLASQLTKYTDNYGDGAIIFTGGFDSNLRKLINNRQVLFLNGSRFLEQ
jgi:hypothetical protein